MPEFHIDAPSWNSIIWFFGLLIIGFAALILLDRAQHKILSLQAQSIVRKMIHAEFNAMLMDARKTRLLHELEKYELPEDLKFE